MTPDHSSKSDALDGRTGPGLLRRHQNFLTGLMLAILAWVIYFPSIQYGFIYFDDVRILKNHPELYGQPSLTADAKAIFQTGFPREEPLLVRDVTWALDSQIFGFGNPLGYHLGNVLLHGIVVALLFAFLLGITRRYVFALTIAAAYLLLAVHVEPVAWIMGRKDILSALFMLLALCTQTRRMQAKGAVAVCAWHALVLFFFLIALLSKISVLTFPLVLFLHAMFLPYLRGERPPAATFDWGRTLFRELVLLVPSLAISSSIYVWYQRTLAQMGLFDRGYPAHGLGHLWNLLMVNPMVFWIYLKQMFLPTHFAVLHAWPEWQPTYPLWQMVTSILTVAGALAGGVWIFCRRKDLFFYYAAFFVLMVPYLNLIYIGIWVADRYIYFSSFCALAIVVSLAGTVWQRSQPAMRLGVLVVGGAFAMVNFTETVLYEPAWRNAETLWQNHLAQPNHTPAAYANLATYYYADFSDAVDRQDQPRMESAIYKMSIVLKAAFAEYWPDQQQPPPASISHLFFLRSLIEEVEGKPEVALASLLLSDRLHPGFDSTNLNLAQLYRKLAGTATNPEQKKAYALSARDRFATYLKLAYHGRQPPPGETAEMAALEAESTALSKATTEPAPAKPQ